MARLTRQPIFSCQRSLSTSDESDIDIDKIYSSEEQSPLRRTTQDLDLVEIAGIEPATSGLQSRRSPS